MQMSSQYSLSQILTKFLKIFGLNVLGPESLINVTNSVIFPLL